MSEDKQGVVIYNSMYKQFMRLAKRDQTVAFEYIKALLQYGFEGIEPDEDSDVMLYGFDTDKISIDNAAVRYLKAQENGAKGGRPSKQVSKAELDNKYAELKTWAAVAKYYGVSDRTIRLWREPEKTGKNLPEKTSGQFPETEETGKNHDIYIDIDIEKDTDIETESDWPQEGWMRAGQNRAKTIGQNIDKTQNQEEKEKEKPAATYSLSPERITYLENRFCCDGADNEQDHYWLPSDETAALSELSRLGLTNEEARYVMEEIVEKI